MSKMAEFLRPTMRPIGLSIKKTPSKTDWNWGRKIWTTDFVTKIRKQHFLNMTYVDISISDSFDPGKYTRVFDHAEHESDIEISFQNQSEWVLRRFLCSKRHALLKANTTSAGRLRRPADFHHLSNIINTQILHQHYLPQRQKLRFSISTIPTHLEQQILTFFISNISNILIFKDKRLLFVFYNARFIS